MTYETLKYEKRGATALITLNRPQAQNAFDVKMIQELKALWADFKYDDTLAVAVVTGEGEKYFCVGADVKDFVESAERSKFVTRDEGIRYMTSKQNHCWKPVINAINGMVVGGGFHFVDAADINIAADNACFFDTHVALGLVPAFEPIELLRRLPYETVSRMFLLGKRERMSATRACELGLISEVTTRERLMPRAMELAQILSEQSIPVMMATIEVMYKSRELGAHQGILQGLMLREIAGRSVITQKIGTVPPTRNR
ncbi:MAG: enoyl-CoA hydratase/isomerase family protein [Pseudomonadota bacterium]|nr:enoyl-CoA hydratase/isomerase family protein [Pseudomonadota bacterium]